MAELAREWIDAVFKTALELPDAERARFLAETGARDMQLRQAVERLLLNGENDRDLLLQPGGGACGPLWEALARDCAAAFHFEAGERLGAFRIVRVLGQGGMATVYLAERADGQFEQTVALKVLDAARDFDTLAVRFAQERRILARLEHPNIARLIDGGTTRSGQPFVVMEYVDGEPIDQYCDRRTLTVEKRIALFTEVAGAIQYAHGHLIVHRDIKPSNILVNEAGIPKLLDFGIAKLLDDGLAPVTRSALHPMTPEYASPEQLRGEALTTASDVYQLGYLLYKLLTGRSPYSGDRRNVAAIVQAINSADPVRPSVAVISPVDDSHLDVGSTSEEVSKARATTTERLRRSLVGDLDNIILTALQKVPELRYASASHLREDLLRHSRGLPVIARAPTLRYRAAKFVGRNRVGVAASIIVALTLLSGIAATLWQARAAAQEARRASEVLGFLVGLFESVDPDAAQGESITVKQVLDRGAVRLREELADVPLLRAEMLGVIGRMYVDLGLYQEARPLLEEALALRRAAGRKASEALMRSASDLVVVLTEQGDNEPAEALAREVVQRRRASRTTSASDLAGSLSALAVLVSLRGDLTEANALFEEALTIDREIDDQEALATHLGDLGTSFWRQKQYEEAQKAHEEALRIRRELHGERHTLVATSLLDLATVLLERGEFPQSEALFRDALDIQLELLGEGHPHTARTLNNFGDALGRQGKLVESEAMHYRALAARRTAFGDDHVSIAESMNNIAITLYFKGEYGESATMLEEVVKRWTKLQGPDHPNVLAVMNNLGAVRRQNGDYAAAEPVLRETLARRREVFGEQHPDVAQSLNNLGSLLELTGSLDEAESMYRQAAEIWGSTLGEDHVVTAGGWIALGKLLLDRGKPAKAEPLLRRGLEVRAGALDSESVVLAASRLYLAESLFHLGHAGEADLLLAQVFPVVLEQRGPEDELSLRAERLRGDLAAQP